MLANAVCKMLFTQEAHLFLQVDQATPLLGKTVVSWDSDLFYRTIGWAAIRPFCWGRLMPELL